LTGAAKVRRILGLQPGDLYESGALAAGQGRLYRSDLFGSVGFGVEPLPDGDELVLTVTVSELTRPYSRTELFADRGGSAVSVDTRLRNVGGGRSTHFALDLVADPPGGLAETGF